GRCRELLLRPNLRNLHRGARPGTRTVRAGHDIANLRLRMHADDRRRVLANIRLRRAVHHGAGYPDAGAWRRQGRMRTARLYGVDLAAKHMGANGRRRLTERQQRAVHVRNWIWTLRPLGADGRQRLRWWRTWRRRGMRRADEAVRLHRRRRLQLLRLDGRRRE